MDYPILETPKLEGELKELVEKADLIYQENFDKEVVFERAIFFSWYCGLGDCTFCYMSTLKNKIIDPKKARRSMHSIISEAIISKVFGWEIEFLSGGYDSYSKEELLFLIKNIYKITGEKQWLNIGTLNKKELNLFKPYIEGYAGTVETVNWDLRKKVCPSKHLTPILNTFQFCDELDLKKAITIIIGLGETIEDFEHLKKFIKENNISRITFYALNPHPQTVFKKSPSLNYYTEWIAMTRINFPKIHIIAGAWIDKIDYYYYLLKAGANSITKLPATRMFNTKKVKNLNGQVKKAGRNFKSKFYCEDVYSYANWDALVDELGLTKEQNEAVKNNLKLYLKKFEKNLKD